MAMNSSDESVASEVEMKDDIKVPSKKEKKKLVEAVPVGTVQDWKEWRKQKKQQYKKWKEEKLLKKLEKKKQKEVKDLPADDNTLEKVQPVGRHYTTSIAVPSSVLDNAQSPELRCYLAGQIARAAGIFNIDEVVIFDEPSAISITNNDPNFTGVKRQGKASTVMGHILQYLECPQYLRKHFFPLHPDLKYAGLLNPLDSPHHVRTEEHSSYREGVVLNRPVKEGKGSFVDVGLGNKVVLQVDKTLQPGVRVTVKLKQSSSGKKLRGQVVAPHTPRTEASIYWGYSVRIAKNLGEIFTKCPFSGGYDLTIGTSDKGSSVDDVELKPFRHLLIAFGGLSGLEAPLDGDDTLDVDDPSLLFHHYLNTCPGQGSRTIRTEEAILITLASLRPKIITAQGITLE